MNFKPLAKLIRMEVGCNRANILLQVQTDSRIEPEEEEMLRETFLVVHQILEMEMTPMPSMQKH